MKKLIFSVVTFVLILIITEFLFTAVFYVKEIEQSIIHLDFVKDAPYLYYEFKGTKENRRNSDGFITNVPIEKGNSKYRIAIIGGSVAQGLGAAIDENGKLIIEQELNRALNTDKIEVLNAGQAGYVSEQEFIMLQLKLLKYKPDLIFGLDGYNDLMGYRINRKITPEIPLPPQNFMHFKVIEQGKFEKKFYHRFLVLFKNSFRALNFFKNFFEGNSSYDLSDITNEKIEYVSNYYQKIIIDTHDFCKVKGIKYYSFLQPVRYYNNQLPKYKTSNDVNEQVTHLYQAFEQKIENLEYGFTISGIFNDNMDVYTDDCHVTLKGNELFSQKISELLAPIISKDSTFILTQKID